MMPDVVAFDLDLTLAGSKEPVAASMAELLGKLLARTKVAVVSGGMFTQIEAQVVGHLTADAALENVYLLPTSGSALYEYWNGTWRPVYEERLSDTEVATITAAAKEGAMETGLIDFSLPAYGERIEARGSQVTLSALGQLAPPPEKAAWDPSGEKREQLRTAIAARLPEYDVHRGGATSIDITKRGVNKAFGLRKLAEHLSLTPASILYVGDALYRGGNDEIVEEAGILTRATTGPEDTARFIEELLAL